MAVIHDPPPTAERHDRRPGLFRQGQDLGRGILRPAADPDHRGPRLIHHLGQAGDLLGIGHRVRMQGQRVLRRDLGRGRQLIERHFQRHGATAARHHLLKRAGDLGRGLGRVLDPVGVLQQRPQGRELVRQLMQLAPQPADHRAGHLPGDAQDRGIHPPGGGQRRCRVQHPRPGHHGIGGGLPGRAGIAERHVGGGLLVAGVDQAEPVGVPGEGVEQPIQLDARQPEYRIDPVSDQAVNDCFPTGHARHVLAPLTDLCRGRSHACHGWGRAVGWRVSLSSRCVIQWDVCLFSALVHAQANRGRPRSDG